MSDDQETKCILATILALRNQRNERIDCNVNSKKRAAGRTNSSRDTTEQPQVGLPDAIIRDGVLSYRPFRSFKVVLIRGETNSYEAHPSQARREYSLTFGSNRGPLRFRVAELPYLPPRNKVDAELYRGADGVVISCYMARFFEFCDRYGYRYASTSIIEDVQARRQPDELEQESDTEDWKTRNITRRRPPKSKFPSSIVLCGNNVDITHVDARLSTIVFRQDLVPEGRAFVDGEQESTATFLPPKSYIETPRHPFSSLARSLTHDDGLEFYFDVHKSMTSEEEKSEVGDAIAVETTTSVSYTVASSKPYEKFTKINHDDDPRNWNWLRTQVSSS